MPNAHDCLSRLLNQELTVEDKCDALSRYVQWIQAAFNFGKNGALEYVMAELTKACEHDWQKTALDGVLIEMRTHGEHLKKQREEEIRDAASALKGLKEGTPVVIKNYDREEIVIFKRMKRKLFLAERPNGQLLNVPAALFLRLHDADAPEVIPDDQKASRALVRSLRGSGFAEARGRILERGVEMIPVLLDELADTVDRVEDPPIKQGKGAFTVHFPPTETVSNLDLALMKRIPQVVSELVASAPDKAEAQQVVAEYPDPRVRALYKEHVQPKRPKKTGTHNFESDREETKQVKRALKDAGIYARVSHGAGTVAGKLYIQLGDVVDGNANDQEHREEHDRVTEIVRQLTGRPENEIWISFG